MIVRTGACVALLGVVASTHAFAMNGRLPQWGGPIKRSYSPSRSSSSLKATIESPLSSTSNNANANANGAQSQEGEDEDKVKTTDVLSLDSIRSTLIRQEETIIFAIIERAQYRQNSIVYQQGGFPDLVSPPNTSGVSGGAEEGPISFMEYMLIGTETLHCGVRRYTSPEEHAFFPNYLPSSPLAALPSLEYPEDLLSPVGGAATLNFNPILLDKYISTIVPSIAKCGDDEQHGSTVLADIAVLQALSKRVHYGKFVAESKYRSDPEEYQRLVNEGDANGVMDLLTNAPVEARVLRRARIKASTYGREPLMTQLPVEKALDCSDTTSFVAAAAASAVASAFEALGEKGGPSNSKVEPSVIEDIYRDFIIPLTKDIEVAYLFRRCGKEPPAEYAPDRMSRDLL